MEFSSHLYWTEQASVRICKYLQTKEQFKEEIRTPLHLDVVILLTPFCSILEDHYPPRSGFHSIVDGTASVLKQLSSLVYSKGLTSIQSFVVFEQREQWQRFEQESLTQLEKQIEQVYIPYLQSKSCLNKSGVDLYDLLVLDCIHGGCVDLETTDCVFRRLMLITSSPAIIQSNHNGDKNAIKFLNRKGMALDLVYVSCGGFGEQIPSAVIAYCLFSGGNIWNSSNIRLFSHRLSNQNSVIVNECREDMGSFQINYSLQDILSKWFYHEDSVIATSQQWRYTGHALGVFIQWHIQQGFRLNYDTSVQSTSRSFREESYLSFYLLLNERLLVICHMHIDSSHAYIDTKSLECSSHDEECNMQQMDFWVQLELRERKEEDDGIVRNHSSFDRWLSLLACEQLLFQLYTNPMEVACWSQCSDWWKECPCLIFHILRNSQTRGLDVPVIQQVEEFLLSLYPGSTCNNHFLMFHIHPSQFLLFYLIPICPRNKGVKLIFVGLGMFVHQWKHYLDSLFMQDEWNVWCYHLEPSSTCSYFLLEDESKPLGDIESLHFACNNSYKVRIQLWGEANHRWILPTANAAHRVWQIFCLRLKTVGWSTLQEEENGLDGNRMMNNVVSWWIGAHYPLVIGLERERNQVKLYCNHRMIGKDSLLDVASYTAVSCYYALDVVLDLCKVNVQQMINSTELIVKMDDSIWHFANVVYHAKVKSRLLASFHFNIDWMTKTICQQGDWMPIESNDKSKRMDTVIGEYQVESKCLTFVRKIYWQDKNVQHEWLVGMIILITQQGDPISLFIVSLQPIEWLSHLQIDVIQRGCRYHGSCVVQQIKRNIFWNIVKEKNESVAQLWNEEIKNWKPVRWSLNEIWSENGQQEQLFCTSLQLRGYVPYAMKWLIEMLSSCGYHPLLSDDDCTTWLRFHYEEDESEQLRVVAKIYRNDIQVWLELYNLATGSEHSRRWKNWILFHEWIMKILGKYLRLCFNNYFCFSSWVLLDDMSVFCEDCLKCIFSEHQASFRETTKVVEWRQQNVWLLQSSHIDLSLEVHVRKQQEWPLQCVLSLNYVSKGTWWWENVSLISQFLWSAFIIEYLQGKYLVQQWNQLDIPTENKVASRWLIDEENINTRNEGMLFQFRSMELEWKYKEISKIDFIEEWKRQLCEQKGELHVDKNSHKWTCVGLASVSQLQRILSKGTQGIDETRDNWILFVLEIPLSKWNDNSIVAKTMSLPLRMLDEFLCQNDNKTGNQITEWLQEIEQTAEESNTWLHTWFSSVLFHLHQIRRWKVEIEICKKASSWNRQLFMDTFPHYSFFELCRNHFADFGHKLVKTPKLPLKNELEWDKIINPMSTTFSETFQLLRRNELEEDHIWYLIMSSQQDDAMLLLHLPLKEEPKLELIMQSTDQIMHALHLVLEEWI
ncbi:hypothetical protein Gasu2_10890 [Galdieria sulphuraria]|nr:hypothetical protein Gasu2_10890 [Galdieria sulphuraria]